MNDIEMILNMAEMQKKLDKALLAKGKKLGLIDGYDKDRCTFALIDELGELTHELKSTWCWWKATQSPVNNEKVLEELVDCWHFALSLQNNSEYGINPKYFGYDDESNDILRDIKRVVDGAMSANPTTVVPMCELTTSLGFSIDDVYLGYLKKNQENYDRIARGY